MPVAQQWRSTRALCVCMFLTRNERCLPQEHWSLCADSQPEMTKWLNGIAKAKRPRWLQDEAAPKCAGCEASFSALNRKHHCRSCGNVYCGSCAPDDGIPLPGLGYKEPVRACLACVQRSKGGKPRPPRPAGTAPPQQGHHEKGIPTQGPQAKPHIRMQSQSPPQADAGRGPFLPRFLNDGAAASTKGSSATQRLREKVERHKAASQAGRSWLS